MTFGVCIYNLAGLLIPIRLWVCLQVSVISSWRRMLGERELCVLPSGERGGLGGQFRVGDWRGHTFRIYVTKDCS